MILLWSVVGQSLSAAEPWERELRALFTEHCLECHSGDEPAGGFDIANLAADFSHEETLRRWIQIHDRMLSGEMPPVDTKPVPPAARTRSLRLLQSTLTSADRQSRKVVLRRLNRNEYENTVRDLFGVQVRVKEALPQDNSTDGFDNIGEGLAVSAEAAQAYLRAADIVVDAIFGPAKKPKSIYHETNLLDQKTFDGKPQLANQYGKMFRQTEHGVVIFQSNYCPTNLVNFARLRAPVGTYRCTIKARAIQSKESVTLRVYGGDTIVGRRENHLVGYYDIPPGEWTTVTFEDQLVEPNGTFLPKCYGTRDTRKDADTYPEPGIELGDITIEGPLEEWPPRSRVKLMGSIDPQTAILADAEKILAELLPRAFRRPTSAEDMTSFSQLVKGALDEGRDFESALRVGLKGILCSPEFLFLEEASLTSENPAIDGHALASRLSYFLWSSMPDARLFTLAREGKLSNTDVLRSEVERMLEDPKVSALTENFVGQWLDLRDIDFTSPDMNLYPDFDELLRVSMVEETELFFEHLITKDLSLLNFIDSEFAFLNQRLAEHYGIPGIRGQEIRRVDLPTESVRGGVLTQAAVLKVTANGTSTSPVLRGVWVLDNILGETVPPPPSNVPAVEPDIRGAVTLREQLAKHRDIDSCAVCHQKIDPPGFALENFDVIGGWREQYRTLGEGRRSEVAQDPHTFAWIRYRHGLPVDATGRTSQGEDFRDIRDFKSILLGKKQQVTTNLTRKMASYALGRRIGFSDRESVASIASQVAENDYGLRTLVHEIVQNEMFRRP
jgi:hypothetical protein